MIDPCQPIDFPGTRHLMYCAEQIVVPPKLPNILKDYAKAVIRTQPYDLLRWSAAYFRCLDTNVPPPVKIRLEPVRRFGTLTRGYLKVLLEQVGKGFFVNRDVLQNRWESLSLPQDELLSFLSLCRMLDWPQVHWLKLIAAMVGTLNDSLIETLTMLCELLTEDVEGSPCPVPMWIAREVYTFLAELDCSCEQKFVDGRKVIGVDGELEPKSPMPDLPTIMNLESFRCAILERFFTRLGINAELDSKDYPYRLDYNGDDSSATSEVSTLSTRPSHVSSSFRFVGNFEDPTEVIRRTPDFDSVILLLHETQGFKLHEYHGAHDIGEKTLRHVMRREAERNDRIQHIKDLAYADSVALTQEQHDKLLKDIEPPWSWIHHFAAANCREKSYNYLESQSIASDETPSESSDESFDFEKNRFYEAPKMDDGASTDKDEEKCIENLLLQTEGDGDKPSTEDVVNTDGLISDVLAIVESAVNQKTIDLTNTSSIISLLDDEIHASSSKLDLGAVCAAIRIAEDSKIVFRTLDELNLFLREKVNVPVLREEIPADDTPITVPSSDSVIEIVEEPPPAVENKVSDEILSSTKDEETPNRKPIENQFEDCMIEIDEKSSKKTIPDTMIVGLVPTPPATPIIIPTPPRTPSPVPPSPHNTSSGIITANVSLDEFCMEIPPLVLPPPVPPPPPKAFECLIPPIPGIGGPVSRDTIRNFVTFLKGRSRNEKGMVYPRQFRETKCPNMIDTYEG